VVWKFGLGFRKINHGFTVALPVSTVSNSGVKLGRNPFCREILEHWLELLELGICLKQIFLDFDCGSYISMQGDWS